MDQGSLGGLKRIAVLIIPVLILIGCVPTSPPAPPTVAPVQPTVAPAQPTVALPQAVVTAEETPVQISKANSAETPLQKDDAVDVQVNDTISVPEAGHAVIRFADRLIVDVLRGSEYRLADVKPEPGNAIFVTLRQVSGHSRVDLTDSANARVRVETDFGTITSQRPGTEFQVCHDPSSISCFVVTKGEAEVVGHDGVVTLKEGEATYMGADEGPLPPICAHMDEVNAWFDQKLSTGEVQPLGALVSSWKQESCATLAAEKAAAAVSTPLPLPPSTGMVKVEAGDYWVGSAAPDAAHIPAQKRTLPAFWIDAYEVTNAEYQAFVDQTGHAPPATWPGKPKNPVQGVTWDDAAAYCTWANKRLPSEAEWEAAARGPGANPPLYPWSDDPSAGGKINDLPLTQTYEVGTYSFNKSPAGVYDMAGNVWEWVGDPYYPVPDGMKILRGGRYGLIEDAAFRQLAEPNSQRLVPYAGFRCAASQVQGG